MYNKDSLQENNSDSVYRYYSSKYPMENEKSLTHCEGPIIFKVVNNSVLSNNVAFDKVMYQFINGVIEEKPFQTER